MNKTHGNCAGWIEQSETHVFCRPDMLPACWYSKDSDASKCKCWMPRIEELHLKLVELVGEFYEGSSTPLAIIAKCDDGNQYSVQPSHLMQVRLAGWECKYHHYTFDENRYCRQTWRGDQPLSIVVIKDSVLGERFR